MPKAMEFLPMQCERTTAERPAGSPKGLSRKTKEIASFAPSLQPLVCSAASRHPRFPSPLAGEGGELPKAARRVRGNGLKIAPIPLTRLIARLCSQFATLSRHGGGGEEAARRSR